MISLPPEQRRASKGSGSSYTTASGRRYVAIDLGRDPTTGKRLRKFVNVSSDEEAETVRASLVAARAAGWSPYGSAQPPKQRRKYGTGSIVSQADGSFVGFLSLGRDPRTRKRQRATTRGDTEREVEHKLRELDIQRARGVDLVGAKVKLGVFVDGWFGTLRPEPQGNYSPATLDGYRRIIDRYIKPMLGHLTLAQLVARGGALYLENFQNRLFDQGLSSQTVLNIRNTLRGSLTYAVRMGLIDQNPFVRVTAPRASRHEGQTIDEDGARRLLEVIRGHPYEAAILLMLACGLRRAEVLGLEWSALANLDAPPGDPRRRPSLHVRQTRLWAKSRGMFVKQPKTAKSRRVLFLSRYLVTRLQERKRDQALDPIRAINLIGGKRYDFVFTNEQGAPPAPNTFTRTVKDCLVKAGLPDNMRGHDLRHSFASILQAEGMPPSGAMAAMGHSTVQMTMGTYTHVGDPLRHMAADIFDGFLGRVSAPS